jgi:AP-1 complex subunit beta-1
LGNLCPQDIFRRYPNQYESIIGTLCENLDTLDEPEAKASMIWIIGEYAERIDNADELLETFLETFPEEVSSVQLQLLTATVKLFLKKPTERPQQMIQLVLSNATQETDNPDLRDRAYIYWRLLSSDPEVLSLGRTHIPSFSTTRALSIPQPQTLNPHYNHHLRV